ncbi:polysaccharide biosynthesis/export family protein [Geomonas sp. Red875]|uniref:Polysaccharide biosynthesis/export family protein n=2 Tax=Geomesophilobacter sediminis TaxID=2798584 RepID=A0A8J7M0B0_9BACT|nr:polysaccharide biosynthesis/export family protein [Geomesophilobacter sediminis]
MNPAGSGKVGQAAAPAKAPAEPLESGDAPAEEAPAIELAVPPAPEGAAKTETGASVEDAAAAPSEVPGPAAPPEARQPAANGISWWRSFAHSIGLAADPAPGEVAQPTAGRPTGAPDYVIGPGDLLGISVWRDENLTRQLVVLPDGKISFPLIGELVAEGKTVAQLKKELEGRLAKYVTDAGLTVEVKQSNSMIVYIIGRVNAPGKQVLFCNTNVLQGLAMAGGLNPFAERGKVKIYRQQGERTAVFPFNYDDVADGRHLETNIQLQRGDVILVP